MIWHAGGGWVVSTLLPTRRIVPTTITRITASITAYSAMSCPLSSLHKYRGRWNIRTPLQILILILVYPPERQEEKIVQKAGQRGRAHAFGLASNNRNGFLTCKLKRELGTRVHIPVR